jgi:uncharacterized Ntn-hydrolase superfamily protein
MTCSIVALDASGAFGVAVASRFFAVGALCPAIRNGKGALSTQALINPRYACAGLNALDEGVEAGQVVERLIASDPGREARQLHVIDAAGRTAAHTGRECIPWCGHRSGPSYSVAGNMLAGSAVLEETARVYELESSRPFAERLILAMQAGEAAGGDKRGKQAAALVIHTTEKYPFLDLRVDDHADPLQELMRLYRVSLDRYQPFVECLPRDGDPAGITDRNVIESRIAAFQASRKDRA